MLVDKVKVAFVPGAAMQLSEAQSDLMRTLPPVTRAAPYRWAFGDGATALGHTVLHRYRRPGLYHIWVSGYDVRLRRWFIFDSALVRVVPADQVLGANLSYEAKVGAESAIEAGFLHLVRCRLEGTRAGLEPDTLD